MILQGRGVCCVYGSGCRSGYPVRGIVGFFLASVIDFTCPISCTTSGSRESKAVLNSELTVSCVLSMK